MALSVAERYLAGIQADNGTIARENRNGDRMLREQEALEKQGDAYAMARERRINANRQIARADPGRFSAFETRALLGLTHTKSGDIAADTNERRNALQQHELDMLRQEGQNKIGVAHETALGMRGQGVDAAKVRADADERISYDKSLSQEEIAGINAESAEKLAGINTKSALEIEKERQKGALGVAKEQGRASDYASDAKVDEEHEKGLQMAAQNIREEQIAKWKMEHEKELAQMRLNGEVPSDREVQGLIVLQKLKENEGKSIYQILREFRQSTRK